MATAEHSTKNIERLDGEGLLCDPLGGEAEVRYSLAVWQDFRTVGFLNAPSKTTPGRTEVSGSIDIGIAYEKVDLEAERLTLTLEDGRQVVGLFETLSGPYSPARFRGDLAPRAPQ